MLIFVRDLLSCVCSRFTRRADVLVEVDQVDGDAQKAVSEHLQRDELFERWRAVAHQTVQRKGHAEKLRERGCVARENVSSNQ